MEKGLEVSVLSEGGGAQGFPGQTAPTPTPLKPQPLPSLPFLRLLQFGKWLSPCAVNEEKKLRDCRLLGSSASPSPSAEQPGHLLT